jgi:simple sugar transport system ATP-binding protein
VDNYCSNICEKYNVKTPGTKETIEHLSGGNQQKLVVGRELSENPKLIIAVHPCRGLDVGATNFIQRCLIEARDKGAAVLMVSTELYEVMDMSDQIMPMFEGQIMGIIPQQEATREELGKLMSGVKDEKLQPA